MQKYLRDTEELVAAGQHEEALKRHIWFHHHALEHQPSMLGVRLSFALSNWRKLAKVYEPALEALLAIRDEKTEALLSGEGNNGFFADVKAINRYLREEEKSLDLFDELHRRYPDIAATCWHYVKELAFSRQRDDLVAVYLGDPIREFESLKRRYESDRSEPSRGKRFFERSQARFVENCLRLIRALLALGKHREALLVQEKALAVLEDDQIRGAIPAEEA
ncbi:MAG: hypothetical protein AAF733_08950 [Verrucomicrobiota bacterium]